MKRAAAFSLLELLVAVVLTVGLLMLLVAAIRVGTSQALKTQRQSLAVEELRVGLAFLETDVACAVRWRDAFLQSRPRSTGPWRADELGFFVLVDPADQPAQPAPVGRLCFVYYYLAPGHLWGEGTERTQVLYRKFLNSGEVKKALEAGLLRASLSPDPARDLPLAYDCWSLSFDFLAYEAGEWVAVGTALDRARRLRVEWVQVDGDRRGLLRERLRDGSGPAEGASEEGALPAGLSSYVQCLPIRQPGDLR